MSWKKQRRFLVILLMVLLSPLPVLAQSSSNSYRVEESYFGSGGGTDMNSASFNAQGGLGSLGVGSSSSENFDIEAGFLTASETYLEFAVNTTEVDLGTLSEGSTSTGTTTFYVRTYLSSNYEVISLGDAPANGNAQLNPMATTAPASIGTEQFGINLVDNNSPDIGANPVNVPGNSFADGEAATGYDIVDQFRYVAGEAIVRAAANPNNQAVGRTDYTISYIANISGITEGGTYYMNQNLVAVPTY